MTTLFESISLKGIRKADLQQLLSYLNNIEREECYWGNREQFFVRHERLKKWLENAVYYAYNPDIRLPK